MSFNLEFNTGVINSAGLAIKASSSAVVKSANAVLAFVKNKVISVAAGDMPALTGTLATAYTTTYAFQADSAGTLSVVRGNDVLTATGLSLSDLPQVDTS